VRIDRYEADVMIDCQRGTDMNNGFWTGAVCRDPALCRGEGRCYFVARVEHYLEKHGGMPTGGGTPRQRGSGPIRLKPAPRAAQLHLPMDDLP